MPAIWFNIVKRISVWLAKVPEKESAFFWSGLAGMIFAASPFYIAGGLAVASGLGQLADVVLLCSAILLAIRLGSFVIGCVLALARLKALRLFIGGAISTGGALFYILHHGKIGYTGAIALTAIVLSIGFAVGSSLYLLAASRAYRIVRIGYAAVSILLLSSSVLWLFDVIPVRAPEYIHHALADSDAIPLAAQNPALKGKYEFTSFTYGSGHDRQRKAFASGVSVVTPTVDGSAIIKKWDWSRRWLWGFDIDQLPLNGWVWMPKGEGPFPLVLIVHGNHSMADYSDTGYGYLGELLASRGFIAVSVDENFINHSTWEGGLDTLSEDMTIRAWLLLQHLIAIEHMNERSGNPFAGKADMNRIALIGHSRGGQAAILAANFDRFFAADDKKSYRVNRTFQIEAVVAVAPTDMLVYKQNPKINDINYLLLQGSGDADVNTFSGDRQYKRVSFTGSEERFKTSLYIRSANHGQFNTEWNRRDISLPTQLFLNKKDLLDGKNQRTIAKVYVSAFLETVFHMQKEYLPMFKDYRHALPWLPDTEYVNRYMDSGFQLITDYEEDWNKEKGRMTGVTLSAENTKAWTEQDLKNRRNFSQMNRVVKLEWEKPNAAYAIHFPQIGTVNELSERSSFSFSMANLPDQPSIDFNVTIAATSANGVTASIPLSEYLPVPDPVETTYLKSEYLENEVREGGLSTTAEPVLQTYEVPFSEFIADEPAFDPSRIAEIRFLFNEPADGGVMLDEIGFYLSRRS